MPSTKRPKPLYQRGDFKLYWRVNRAGENGGLEIVWYDAERKRERSASAGTSDIGEGKHALDKRYLSETRGDAFCPTCGQKRDASGVMLMSAIADYLTLAESKPSFGAIKPRLAHVTSYLATTGQLSVRCDQVDEAWVGKLRTWLSARPVVSPTGKERQRALSTTENSVLQLSAVIADRGGIKPLFRALQPKEVNQTPTYRADPRKLAEMFRWCLYPSKTRSQKELERIRRDRSKLLAFLRISVATMARPDAAHDVSTAPDRKQWHSAQRILNLNPAGRRQTRKYRATVPMAFQMIPILDDADGMLVPVESVRSAWESMASDIGLPREGEAGMKLIRRSVAHIARSRLPEEAWGEVSIFLGHDRFADTSDLYAPFSPTYLRRVLPVIEELIDEIESHCPGAFYRAVTATDGRVVALGSAKNG